LQTTVPRPAKKMDSLERKNLAKGLLFISPWLIGFLVFIAYPLVYSFVLSLTRYSGFQTPVWLGFQNYTRPLGDDLVWKSLSNTLFYAVWAVPIGLIIGLILALAMNTRVREIAIYRAAIYLPSILPAFAFAFIFIVLINPKFGLVNYALSAIGIPAETNYLGDPTSAKLVIVALSQLGAGGTALIYLAALRGIPDTLYDAAKLDGAGPIRRFFSITLPLLSPITLFLAITAINAGLQIFDAAYILTNGGPNNGTLFFLLYLYNNAFSYAQLGYASALAVFLFIIGLVLAAATYTLSQRFVNYELVS